MLRYALSVALMLAVAGLSFAGTAEARTPSISVHPTLQIAPARPAIGRPVKISGKHLRPNTFYTLLLAVPNAQKPKVRAFFGGLGHTNASGAFSMRTTLPVVVQCGPAVIVALAVKLSSVTARVTLTGCKASSTLKSPPPPPTGKKKSKRKKP